MRRSRCHEVAGALQGTQNWDYQGVCSLEPGSQRWGAIAPLAVHHPTAAWASAETSPPSSAKRRYQGLQQPSRGCILWKGQVPRIRRGRNSPSSLFSISLQSELPCGFQSPCAWGFAQSHIPHGGGLGLALQLVAQERGLRMGQHSQGLLVGSRISQRRRRQHPHETAWPPPSSPLADGSDRASWG